MNLRNYWFNEKFDTNFQIPLNLKENKRKTYLTVEYLSL